MKDKIILISLITLLNNFCFGQYISEDEDFLDTEEIILNYRDHKINHFAITYDVKSDGIRTGKIEKSYFTIEKDSLLFKSNRRRKKGAEKFLIRNNMIYDFPASTSKNDGKNNTNEIEDNPDEDRYFIKERDSANAHFTNTYRINHQDTF